jgi:hypothetical protein
MSVDLLREFEALNQVEVAGSPWLSDLIVARRGGYVCLVLEVGTGLK